MIETHVFRADALTAAVRAIVAAAGSVPDEAARVAANLVEANLRGHDSHGVGMVPRYIDAVLEGGLTVNAHVAVRSDSGALLTLDGQSGYGQVIGAEAMALGIERARQQGVCIVGLAHSHHLGRIGHWAEQCITAGLVSIHFVNVLSRPIVAPFGGRDARLGTNPFCVGIPRPGGEPIVLDFATSQGPKLGQSLMGVGSQIMQFAGGGLSKLGGGLMTLGHVVFAWNLWLMRPQAVRREAWAAPIAEPAR